MESLFVFLTDQSGGIAYWIVFGILVACGLGFPLPEDIPLISAGYLVWEGTMNLPLALAVTLAGVAVGDTMLFMIGRKLGPSILDSQGIQAFFKPKRIQKIRDLFAKYGEKIVFFARFLAGFRGIAFFTAGAMKMPYRRFITLDMLAALLSVPLWLGLGYVLGQYWGSEIEEILVEIKRYKTWFTLGTGLIVVLFFFRYFMKFRKAKELNKEEPL